MRGVLLSCAFLALFGVACGGKEDRPGRVDPGNGGGGNVSSNGGAGGQSGGAGGQSGGSGGQAGNTNLFFSGSALVAYFSDASGPYFVEESGVTHTDWEGNTLASYAAPRFLTTAAFDATQLVVADAAKMTVLGLDLQPLREATLQEGCSGSMLASGGRFICAPDTDIDRIFYTYSTSDGTLLGTSDAYTYNGVPMKPVPGADLFITASISSSPSDYHLYHVDADTDSVEFLGESPYHGGVAVWMSFGFFGEQATHLISYNGVMHRLQSASCVPGGAPQDGCLEKDGEYGTLPGSTARYLAFSEPKQGTQFALVTADGGTYQYVDHPCSEVPCMLQRVDTEKREVVGTAVFPAGEERHEFYLMAMPDGDSVLVITSGRSIYNKRYSESLPFEVHRVQLAATN